MLGDNSTYPMALCDPAIAGAGAAMAKDSDASAHESLLQSIRDLLSDPAADELCRKHGLTRDEFKQWLDERLLRAEGGHGRPGLETGTCCPAPSLLRGRGLFDILVDSIPHAVFAKDLKGTFVYGNPAYCRIQKITLAELIGKNDFDIHPPEFARKYRSDDRRVVETGQVFRGVEENTLKAGDPTWTGILKAPLRDENGLVHGIIGMFWDMSDQFRAEEALRRSEANLRRLIEHAPLPIGLVTLDGTVRYLNMSFTDLFGYTIEEIPTLNRFWEIACPEETLRKQLAERAWGDFDLFSQGEKYLRNEYMIMDKDGTAHHVQATGSLQGDTVVIMISDITKLKEVEERLLESQETLELTVKKRTQELLEANKRLEDSNKHKTMFLSSVSHELRTPLTSILGFAKMITRDMQTLGNQQEAPSELFAKHASRILDNSQIIAEEGLRLKRLIDNLLDFSKIESGEMTWLDVNCDMAQLARDSLKAMQGLFAANPAIALASDIPDTPVPVRADPDRIMQIFINLLNNAAKFTQQGRVSLGVRIVDKAWAEGRVADTGPGISDQDIAHIFETYFQGIPAYSQDKGTGLGLSISRQIVSHYGGKFWVESALGKGSTFTFRLPLSSPS